MKIYEIGTGYTPIPARMGAATEIVVEELTKSLLSTGKDVEIIDIASDSRAENKLPIREVRVPGIFKKTDVQLGLMHKLKRVAYSVSLAFELKKLLRESEVKIVLHFHNQYNLFFFLKLNSKKTREKAYIAYTVHSHIWHDKWSDIKDVIRKKYFQECTCLKHANCSFVLNDQTKSNIVQHLNIPEKKVLLIDNGVNTDIYHPLATEKIAKLRSMRFLDNMRVFVQVGSICERKNQLSALKMLAPLMKRYSDIAFCYAGGIISNEYQQSIIQYAKDHGLSDRVHYLGELAPGSQLNDIYNIAEAMLFPSKAEGFSLVILEAMSAGLPVIISSKLHFALSSACINYVNPEDIAILIENSVLDKNTRSLLAENCRNTIIANYSWDKIAETYYTVWRNAINE